MKFGINHRFGAIINKIIFDISASNSTRFFAEEKFLTIFALRNFLIKQIVVMSRVCQISGKRPLSGNNVSHANNRTRRKFYPNLHKKRYYIPEEDRWITLKVSTSTMRTINKNGISKVLREARKKGNTLI